MKKIFFILLSAFVVFGSCRNDESLTAVNGLDKEVDIVLITPGLSTRAVIADEDRIERLDILVFQGQGDGAEFLYRRYAWPKTNTANGYRTTLKMGQNLTLFFIANAGDVLDNLSGGILDEGSGVKWSVVREALLLDDPRSIKYKEGLPMWGELRGLTIQDLPVNDLGGVNMLRSVASADFKLGPNVSNFELESVYLVYAADKGYLPYHSSQVVTTSGGITATEPVSPPTMQTNVDWEHAVPGGKAVENVFYMYDNDTTLPSGDPSKNQTKLVMKGTWTDSEGSGRITYYPLAFRETNEQGQQERMMATRNTKYLVTVTKVNGDGFWSLEEAKQGEEINLEYNVMPWDEENDEEIMVVGNKYVSLSSKRANIFRGINTTGTIEMSTNYLKSDVRMHYEKSGLDGDMPVMVQLEDETTKEQFCSVSFSDGMDGRYIFTFTSLRSFPSLDPSLFRQSTLYVKVGRITFELLVRQHNMSETDWEEDGKYFWP